MLWSICILTVSRRDAKFRRLTDILLPQAEADGDVEVIGYRNDGSGYLSCYRQALLDEARGEYVSYVDDDDLVTPDYVGSLAKVMRSDKPDCIGLWLSCEGMPVQRAVLSARHVCVPHCAVPYEGKPTVLGYTNHITPVRTRIARQAGFPGQLWCDEDEAYSRALSQLLGGAREVMVPRELYRYLWDAEDTARKGPAACTAGSLPAVGSPCFRWHPQTI